MKFLVLSLLLFTGIISHSQNDLRRIALTDLPEDIQNIKHVSIAVRWTDSLGDNILVTTKKITQSHDEDVIHNKTVDEFLVNRSYATSLVTIPAFTYHFLLQKDAAVLTWKTVGISKACEGERVNHAKNWFVITDLNKDGRAEVWNIYKSVCTEDENSAILKIIMYEDDVKYTVDGTMEGKSFHEAYFDLQFKTGHELFKKYAIRLWNKFVDE